MKLFVGAKAVIVREDGKVLLLRESDQYLDGTNAGKWDLPGGRIESDERLLDGLYREVKEECGLDVQADDVLFVDDSFNDIKGECVHIVRIYFKCTMQSSEVTISNDHDEWVWIASDELCAYNVISDVEVAIGKLIG